MAKAELVKVLVEKAGITQTVANRCVDVLIEAMVDFLKKEQEIRLTGFGTFKVVKRKERKGKNPKTGETIIIPAKKVVKFVPGKNLIFKE